MSKYKDIQKKSDKDLRELVREKREEIRSFRFSTTGGGTRDVRSVRAAKKEVAQALTELTARTKGGQEDKA